ncbi:MAG: P-II family nitrogen regulator [Gammaproteobacteria bacterium]|nr:P-II family nitrogen regulator [Gammaproteobacteria bacterium]
MKELKVICRKERVERVVATLRAAGVPRLTLSHVHALGSGVDPEHYRLAFEEGAAYTEKAKIELVCRGEDVPRLVDLVLESCRTGQRGDGVIFVTDIARVVKIRTGDENALALL